MGCFSVYFIFGLDTKQRDFYTLGVGGYFYTLVTTLDLCPEVWLRLGQRADPFEACLHSVSPGTDAPHTSGNSPRRLHPRGVGTTIPSTMGTPRGSFSDLVSTLEACTDESSAENSRGVLCPACSPGTLPCELHPPSRTAKRGLFN